MSELAIEVGECYALPLPSGGYGIAVVVAVGTEGVIQSCFLAQKFRREEILKWKAD